MSVDRQGAPSPAGTVGVMFSADTGRYSDLFKNLNDLKLPEGSVQSLTYGARRSDMLNHLVATALASNSYWIWFISEDYGFEPGIVEMLLSRNEALVAPISVDNRAPFYPKAWTEVSERGEMKPLLLDQIVGPASLIEVRGASVTGMLVRRAVFEAMDEPWFKPWYKEVESEDLYFSERAKDLGFQIYADTSARLSTMSTSTITPAHKANRWELGVEVGDMRFAQSLRH